MDRRLFAKMLGLGLAGSALTGIALGRSDVVAPVSRKASEHIDCIGHLDTEAELETALYQYAKMREREMLEYLAIR